MRPESFSVETNGSGLEVNVRLVEELGVDAYVYASLAGDSPSDRYLVVRFDGRVPPRIGETIPLAVRSDELHAFHPASGERLG